MALDDEDTTALLYAVALRLARAQVPEEVAHAIMSARMTALLKRNGGVRGIATGTAFRRLVASCLARTYGGEIDEACAPFQYALRTRAGTECVGHLFRALTERDPNACILSVDGIGAYDHVRRDAMLGKLRTMPKAALILPFVRLSYAQPTAYVWTKEHGENCEVRQGEGGEQGDPLMPFLFALGIHDALEQVAAELLPGEEICAFLDDVYALCAPDRVVRVHELLSQKLKTVAGIQLHLGKTRVYNAAGEAPPRVAKINFDKNFGSDPASPDLVLSSV